MTQHHSGASTNSDASTDAQEVDTATIWTRYSWDCPACGAEVLEPLGTNAPNRGDELECDACGATALAGETR